MDKREIETKMFERMLVDDSITTESVWARIREFRISETLVGGTAEGTNYKFLTIGFKKQLASTPCDVC